MDTKKLWLTILLSAVTTVAAAQVTAPRPNVLLLVADDMRPDAIHALGHSEIQTPHLDQLARQGMRLTNATCAYPLCVPSRAEMLTGCSSFRQGVGVRNNALGRDWLTWPAHLQQAGYRTFHVGKWHVAGKPSSRGYSKSVGLFAGGKKPERPQFDHRGRPVTGYVGWMFQTEAGTLFPELGVGLTPDISALFADAAIQVIREPAERPYFLQVNFTAPHDPRLFPTDFQHRYDAARLSLPPNFLAEHPFDHGNRQGRDEVLLPYPRTAEEIRAELAAYYAVISHLDEQVGRILSAVDALGQSENTLVIFTSDHGLAVGSHGLVGKQNMYDHTIRVPMIVRGPGIPAGSTWPGLCYLRDLFPTVCEFSGVEIPPGIDGRSLAGPWRGQGGVVHPFVVGSFQNVQRMIRTERWKLIWYPQVNREQLFDVEHDPQELHDLAGRAEFAAQQSQLRDQLRKWLSEQQDPVLSP